ncbi:hypothetical protein GFS31_31310 [Leptolyngbya sp. BL0902]|uniref:hypothetical protein n=1 Tax=Leptolyngbya sp. BL0902 TaxID=1115757 RepID=UPI0018E8DAAB|nr:hypothetical protein [Leptolyngbya sp. BL0902]QQE66433.1 hypothetical protein GFS31_31310 [Leptolyngbya sp. BL0902]
MAALYEQWQNARTLRQQEVAERREQVQVELEAWQDDRLTQATELHQHLSDMAEALRIETAEWLNQTTEDRLAQIPPLRQALQRYTEELQAETQALLADHQADRELSAAITRQKLAQDRQDLSDTVDELRLDIAQDLRQIQQEVETIQKQTAVDLAGYRQDQAMMRAELLPELADYVANLKADVSQTLDEITVERQIAEIEQQEKRQQDRQALTERVEAMFEELAGFRQHLAEQRAAVTEQVWGTGAVRYSPPKVQQAAPRVTPKPAPKPAPKPTATARPAAVTRPTRPVAPARPVATPKAAQPTMTKAAVPSPAPSPAPVASVTAPQAIPQPVPQAEPVATVMPPVEAAVAVVDAPVAVAAPPVAKADSPTLEEVVYNYLHLANGARISEIETELGITRFQAVDALHALIQKGLIVKQDRTYLAKEEALL